MLRTSYIIAFYLNRYLLISQSLHFSVYFNHLFDYFDIFLAKVLRLFL